MGAGEFIFCLLAEGVMPDEPVPQHQFKLISNQTNIRSVVVAYCYIKRAMRFQNLLAGPHPLPRPRNVFFLLYLVLVFVVFIPDIKRGVCKYQIRKRLFHRSQHLDAVPAYYLVQQFRHSDIL